MPVFEGLDLARLPDRPLHLAIGMFDGVHLGHQAVIESALHSAVRSGGVAAVLTFWPHPSALISPGRRTRMLMEPAMKHRVLARLGIEAIIEQPFGVDFARITASEFLPRLKQALPTLAGVYVGDNWRFGSDRTGDVAFLVREAERLGVSIISVPRICFNGTPISSTRIRENLRSGKIEEVNQLLGYTYFAEGETQPGRRLGRTIGFPTLNLAWQPELEPQLGVYAVRVSSREGGERLPGVANYGLRPTVDASGHPLLEVHLLSECPFECGSWILVEWIRFIRAEARFPNLEALKNQISRDCEAARAEFSLQPVR